MTWQRVEPLVTVGGDVGGDYQVSESYSARWTRRLTCGWWAIVTRYHYISEGVGQGLHIEEQTEYLVCTDPAELGGTERQSDYGYRTVPWEDPFDDAAARAAAGQAVEPTDLEWAGSLPGWELAS